jgi:phenylacetate-CoA ligase
LNELRRHFTRYVAQPLVWRVWKKSPVFSLLAEWRERQWDSPDDFHRRQDRSLGALLKHAVTNVPFYSEVTPRPTDEELEEDPRACLARFPVLSKADLLERRDDFFHEMHRGTYWNVSSGTTGVPVRIAQDIFYQAGTMASILLFYEWAGVELDSPHVKLWGMPRDAAGKIPLKLRVADWLANRITLDAFAMDPDSLRGHLRVINRVRPACLEGYVNALHELAVFAQNERIPVTPPGCVVSSAGTLLPHMRERMESAFGAPVYDRYGTREVGAVASECANRDGMHILGEATFVEVVRGDGHQADPGEEGEILITTLRNHTMPLIRYRIGDRGALAPGACSCGRPYPRLARLAGRSEECVYRRDGGRVLPEFLMYLFALQYNDGSIVKFQFVQESIDQLEVRLVAAAGRRDEALANGEAASARIRQAMGDTCDVRVRLVDRIDPTPTGKHLHVISRVAGERT